MEKLSMLLLFSLKYSKTEVDRMSFIAKQPYIKVERKVTSISKYEVEHQRYLTLYDDRIVTQHRTFPIEAVLDMTYRKEVNHNGMLYLHTNQGVYSYVITSSPEDF